MKFTKSKDGIERATIRLSVRLSREELEKIRRVASVKTHAELRSFLEHCAYDDMYKTLVQWDEEHDDDPCADGVPYGNFGAGGE